MLRWIGFVVLRGEPVSQRDAALVAATLPRMKGPTGFVRGGAWWELARGLRSFTQSRRCCASFKVAAERSRSRIRTKKLDLKSNCGSTTA